MFCPGCGLQAGDESAFCRACGANLGLVSQALSGQLVTRETAEELRRRARAERTPSVVKTYHDESGTQPQTWPISIFSGLGFLLVSLAIWKFVPNGRLWWFWLLIPAFSLIGKGIAQLLTYSQNRALPPSGRMPAVRAPDTGDITPRDPYRMGAPPPSVVEGTTKLMDRADSK